MFFKGAETFIKVETFMKDIYKFSVNSFFFQPIFRLSYSQ